VRGIYVKGVYRERYMSWGVYIVRGVCHEGCIS